MYLTSHLKHVSDYEIGVFRDGEPVILQDLRRDPLTVDVCADAVSFLDAEIISIMTQPQLEMVLSSSQFEDTSTFVIHRLTSVRKK